MTEMTGCNCNKWRDRLGEIKTDASIYLAENCKTKRVNEIVVAEKQNCTNKNTCAGAFGIAVGVTKVRKLKVALRLAKD